MYMVADHCGAIGSDASQVMCPGSYIISAFTATKHPPGYKIPGMNAGPHVGYMYADLSLV